MRARRPCPRDRAVIANRTADRNVDAAVAAAAAAAVVEVEVEVVVVLVAAVGVAELEGDAVLTRAERILPIHRRLPTARSTCAGRHASMRRSSSAHGADEAITIPITVSLSAFARVRREGAELDVPEEAASMPTRGDARCSDQRDW